MSYKSPIELITEETILHMEDDIVKAVQKYGINVNKTELQKALMYDRKQYTQGFEDGKKSAEEDYRSMERTVEKLTKALAEAEPIRHGRWLKTGQSFIYPDRFRNYFCSVCLYELDRTIREKLNYCPNCGAKMEEMTE